MVPDLRRNLEALIVVRPLFVQEEVPRGVAVLALRETLGVLDLRRSARRLADMAARFDSLVAGYL